MIRLKVRGVGFILGLFFFSTEAGSYLLGVLASTILVKRGGPEWLPYAYAGLNLLFLPIVVLALLKPPQSSMSAVRNSLTVYVVLLLACSPFTAGENPAGLCLVFIVARLGKLVWNTFALGMIPEVLTLRDSKELAPKLLACGAGGIIAGGLMLQPSLAYLGTQGSFILLWSLVVLGLGLLAVLPVPLPPGNSEPTRVDADRSGRVQGEGSLASLFNDPLVRILAVTNFFIVGIRYILEFVYTSELSRAFPTEQAMASFAGNFEAVLQICTIFTQLALVGPLLSRMRVGGMSLILPAIVTLASLATAMTGGFYMVILCQFLYWVGVDGFTKPSRQILMGAVDPRVQSRVPVVMAALGMMGSLGASFLLIPVSMVGQTSFSMALLSLIGMLFLLLVSGTSQAYSKSLSGTLERLDSDGRVQILSAIGKENAPGQMTALAALMESTDSELRLEAAIRARDLPGDMANTLVEKLLIEPDPHVRSALVLTLAHWRQPELVEVIEGLLIDPVPRVRSNSLEALAAFPERPFVKALALAGLESTVPRERAAAIFATVSLASDTDSLTRALDVLSDLLDDQNDASRRAAGVAVMGRLGFGIFALDIQDFLDDPVIAVRMAAVDALKKYPSPSTRSALRLRLDSEENPDVHERISRALESLYDGTVSSILDCVDSFTAQERARVVSTLEVLDSDRQAKLLARAVMVQHAGLRSALIHLTRSLKDESVTEVLLSCIVERDGVGWVNLDPLLDYLSASHRDHDPREYATFNELFILGSRDELTRHVIRVIGRLWTCLALSDCLARHDDPKWSRAAGEAQALKKKLLNHVLSVISTSTQDPERSSRILNGALMADPRQASLCLELMEDWLNEDLRSHVLELLEAWPHPERCQRIAIERTGMDPAAEITEETIRSILGVDPSRC